MGGTLFVHHSEIQSDGFRKLTAGQKISFIEGEKDGRRVALQVAKPDGTRFGQAKAREEDLKHHLLPKLPPLAFYKGYELPLLPQKTWSPIKCDTPPRCILHSPELTLNARNKIPPPTKLLSRGKLS